MSASTSLGIPTGPGVTLAGPTSPDGTARTSRRFGIACDGRYAHRPFTILHQAPLCLSCDGRNRIPPQLATYSEVGEIGQRARPTGLWIGRGSVEVAVRPVEPADVGRRRRRGRIQLTH